MFKEGDRVIFEGVPHRIIYYLNEHIIKLMSDRGHYRHVSEELLIKHNLYDKLISLGYSIYAINKLKRLNNEI